MYIGRIGSQPGGAIDRLSLVKNPANRGNFYSCGRNFCGIDQLLRRVTAPVLVPLEKFYRAEPERWSYFTPEAITDLSGDFLRNRPNRLLTLNHAEEAADMQMDIVESWVSKEILNGYPIGTWFATMQILDDGLWRAINNGEYGGMSIEAMLKEEKVMDLPKDPNLLVESMNGLDKLIQREIAADIVEPNIL